MRKNYKEIIKMTLAIIGAIVGICGCAVFAGKYHNYNAAVWAAVSAKFALFFLLIVFFAHRDVERKIMPVRFKLCIVISGIGMVMGLSVFIAYLVVGATSNERGVDVHGSYVVVVWGYMMFKWSLSSFVSSRSYYKEYRLTDGNTMIINS